VKPKASDALCILPVEKCDFNFMLYTGRVGNRG